LLQPELTIPVKVPQLIHLTIHGLTLLVIVVKFHNYQTTFSKTVSMFSNTKALFPDFPDQED